MLGDDALMLVLVRVVFVKLPSLLSILVLHD
jgi:hypothetical protein